MTNPIIQVLARSKGGWRVCITYHGGEGVHAWQRIARTMPMLRAVLRQAAVRYWTLVRNSPRNAP